MTRSKQEAMEMGGESHVINQQTKKPAKYTLAYT
jgi:hypothetical protein